MSGTSLCLELAKQCLFWLCTINVSVHFSGWGVAMLIRWLLNLKRTSQVIATSASYNQKIYWFVTSHVKGHLMPTFWSKYHPHAFLMNSNLIKEVSKCAELLRKNITRSVTMSCRYKKTLTSSLEAAKLNKKGKQTCIISTWIILLKIIITKYIISS